jgi:hypothetical protein
MQMGSKMAPPLKGNTSSLSPESLAVPSSARRRYSGFQIAVRLFVTCWLIYSLHVATNTVREIYLALAMGDHFSFRVDEYARIHPDLFEKPGFGWHINANPGASMLGAAPYALFRPVVDRIVERVNRGRAAGHSEPPAYDSPWPMAREFYKEAWRRGYDVKFGLAAILMQWFCMAPISAAGVVAMFFALRSVLGNDRTAVWLAVLYAFGTPVFFRAGYLNHNMIAGHLAFLGFLAIWNPGGLLRWSVPTRYFLAGLTGGAALLMDYSGVILLLSLFIYGAIKAWSSGTWRDRIRSNGWYVLGAAPPVLTLWFYQWRCFGNPFLPAQRWMAPVAWIDVGYQGFSFPQRDLLTGLLFDYRYGLLVSAPLMLLAIVSPLVIRGTRRLLPPTELMFCLLSSIAFWLFCGGIHYGRLQFNTGIRYMASMLPFLFPAAAFTLIHLPRRLAYFVGVLSIAQAWCMAMYRDVERGLGALEPVAQIFASGFKLPILSVLSRIDGPAREYFKDGVSPLPLLLLTAALLYGIWSRSDTTATDPADAKPQAARRQSVVA